MVKKILVIQGHPVNDTFSEMLFKRYVKGAIQSGADLKTLILRDLSFELNFRTGYRGSQTLEPDLVEAQQLIAWADHLVFIYPNWWSTFPALVKGFIDRTFLPGFAFRYRKGSLLWDRLLPGRSARLIVTMDTPVWYYRLVYKRPGHNAMKHGILEFCGIKPVRITTLGPIKTSSESQRLKWLDKVETLGQKLL
ncbi:MAG: NAD(P)H-dependent oxidoreductase [Lentimicrobiaceae bacterium]|nr:NAD(P)H-dependent oxidoreductase [Lentimicrobiaceae bacterium]